LVGLVRLTKFRYPHWDCRGREVTGSSPVGAPSTAFWVDASSVAFAAALIAKAKFAGRWMDRTEQKNTNVNYVVSDQPMTEEEWAAERVREH
jgi:hypothetical protein